MTASSNGERASDQSAQMPIVDIHRHCVAEPSSAFEKLVEKLFKRSINWREHGSISTIEINGVSMIAYPDLSDIDAQVRTQDEDGITMSVLSFAPQFEILCSKLFFMPEKFLAERLNDRTAGLVAKHPGKFAFMASVNPAQRSSVAECERCVNELGAKGVTISTSWRGEFLDSRALDHFWEYAQERQLAIYLHPPLLPIGYQKMKKYRLEEVVGRPFDTAMTVASMIYSGAFDRYPGLKVVLPHMGGGLPNTLGRLDFGYRLGYEGMPKDRAAVCQRKPSEYLRSNLYVDVMGFSPAGIRHCIEIFGVDRLLFGSDYPAVDIRPKEHVDMVSNLGLRRDDVERIFWKTADDLFRLGLR
jgi:predicted TIM-barrel fold metal-dependent hydrolase